jgi:predicted MFS family arabinose efflux permease
MPTGTQEPNTNVSLIDLFEQVNYYIVAPTANHYAILLGTDGAFGSTLIGASSLAALFAAFLYSFWYTKSSFRSALIFSSICPFLGNILYVVALSYKSMTVAIGGRILVGFGSAEVVNRQLISSCVSFESMTRASALFVSASAIGMALGVLMAAVLAQIFGDNLKVVIKFFPMEVLS